MNPDQLAIFEQPVTGDTAFLACTHRVPVPEPARRRRSDDWWAALWCPTCDRTVGVVSVIYPRKERAA